MSREEAEGRAGAQLCLGEADARSAAAVRKLVQGEIRALEDGNIYRS